MASYLQIPRQAPHDGQGDGLVTFLPHRLNRHPVVVRGLTADELWVCAGLSAVAGFLAGLLLAWLTHSIAMVPTLIVVAIWIGVFTGGGLLRRQKRGRPEAWLYRQLQWRLAQRYPSFAAYVGGRQLITRSGRWITRRQRPTTSIRRGAA
ncbi:TIGR03750 family conjugal transfer protein [Cupriavidus sp. IDO]|uniref:TIGR03750 family conjugal transfer protein n=1 Tax=Cupriavidus sp. IDO TaxID=1539142 RepID=UPI0005790C11|nr:TIGR03750 family conjugal transfer protein [Cupriavidus sp. IDO]KWR90198.1 conjugal transfer protein [Cupriavidus sp. IDO]